MRVTFQRTGGFAGRKVQTDIDTALLTEAEAGQLERLIERSRFFQLPESLQPPTPKPDRFCYIITVQTAKTSHTVQASEEAVPREMRPLLEWLTKFRSR